MTDCQIVPQHFTIPSSYIAVTLLSGVAVWKFEAGASAHLYLIRAKTSMQDNDGCDIAHIVGLRGLLITKQHRTPAVRSPNVNLEETLQTLNFASSVKPVKTCARVNEAPLSSEKV